MTTLNNEIQAKLEYCETEIKHLKKLLEISNEEQQALIARLYLVIEDERRKIGADVHDTLNTIVLSILGNARQAKTIVHSQKNNLDIAPATAMLKQIEDNADYLLNIMRDIVNTLRPVVLENCGWTRRLRLISTMLKRVTRRVNLNFRPPQIFLS